MNKELMIKNAVKELFDIKTVFNSTYGLKFKTLFKNKNVDIEIVCFDAHCEIGICSYSKDLENDPEFEKAFSNLENNIKMLKESL